MAKGFTKQEIAKITELGGTVMYDNSFARIPIGDAASIGINKLDDQTWKPFIVSCRDARYNIEKKYNADNIDEGIVGVIKAFKEEAEAVLKAKQAIENFEVNLTKQV